ncbi:hypothetical protein MNV49_003399 [Pseudohyphozyma bogoriensis]|nr:hypothetical protein MNV49_003399 [Pseudohyphozyma bogoriensis]
MCVYCMKRCKQIRKLDSHITIFSAPFARGGHVPFGGRSTAIALQNNTTFVTPSTPLDQSTFDELNKLPPISVLMSQDREHDMFIAEYSSAFPSAKLFVPAPVKEKWEKYGKKELLDRVGWTFGKRGDKDAVSEVTGGEVVSEDFGKSFVNEDIAIFHVPTKTLIEADLLFNLPPTEQYSKSTQKSHVFFVTSHLTVGTSFHKRMLWHLLGKDRTGMIESARKVSEWKATRIIPSHGDVIETGGVEAWNKTYEWFLNGHN